MSRFENKKAGVLNSADLKTFKGKLIYWLMFSFLIIICLTCILPTIWVILTGFKDSQEIYEGISFLPKNFSLELIVTRLTESWETLALTQSIINTFLMSLGNLFFTLLMCGLGGYVLSRLKPSGSRLIFVLVIWTMMMPSQMRTVPLFISWLKFPFVADFPWEVSLLNTYWPMWLGAAANSFNIILFKNHFDSVPISYIEAAKLDGCGNFSTFIRIMVPLSTPIIMYVSIMCLNSAWSDFFTPYLVLTEKSMQTLPVKIYLLKGDSMVKMNTYMMALIFSSIPSFLIFTIFQKYIIGGINVGGIKG